MDITKENYYDLYNMAVCLLKAVDSLDPDKMHSLSRKSAEVLVSHLICEMLWLCFGEKQCH